MDDLSRRSLRELLTLARERLGRRAAGLKTRGELIAALRQAQGGGDEVAAEPAAAPSGGGAAAVPSPGVAQPHGEAVGADRGSAGASSAPPTVVTRDFFIARH